MIILNPTSALKRELQRNTITENVDSIRWAECHTNERKKYNQTTRNNSLVQLYCGTTQASPRLLEIKNANISNRVPMIVDCRRKSDIHYGRRHHNPIPPETANISIILLCREHGLHGIIKISVLLMKLIPAWPKLWFELGRNAGGRGNATNYTYSNKPRPSKLVHDIAKKAILIIIGV
jgi:hypothetical protein